MAYIRGVFQFDTTLVFTTKSFAPIPAGWIRQWSCVPGTRDTIYNTSETVDRDIIYFIHREIFVTLEARRRLRFMIV